MAITRKAADLHTHTTASDGTGSPTDNVRLAVEAGLAAVAITDHDTVAGVAEALAEGERLGIEVVPGVEISTYHGGTDIHILGYYTKPDDTVWLERLESLRDTRERRNVMIAQRLTALGFPVSMDEIREAAGKDGKGEETIGRPHIAQVLLGKGYVKTMQEAFDRFLGSGGEAYVNPPRLHPFEALDWIRDAGGTSIVAHPGLYGDDAFVEELLQRGAAGIEVFHSDHGEPERLRYAAMAERYGVIATGGSDYHGVRNGQVFHGPLGSVTVDAAVIALLRQGGQR